ncbi:hypothetical protein RFI_05080, partial [Reticulomyxa filosa]
MQQNEEKKIDEITFGNLLKKNKVFDDNYYVMLSKTDDVVKILKDMVKVENLINDVSDLSSLDLIGLMTIVGVFVQSNYCQNGLFFFNKFPKVISSIFFSRFVPYLSCVIQLETSKIDSLFSLQCHQLIHHLESFVLWIFTLCYLCPIPFPMPKCNWYLI